MPDAHSSRLVAFCCREAGKSPRTPRGPLAALVALALLGPAGLARAADFDFVGYSSATTTGVVGIQQMHATCQADFPQSRMCSSQEILDSPSLPPAPGPPPYERAWIAPSIRGAVAGPDGARVVDASGLEANADAVSCDAWRSFTHGLTYTPNGGTANSISTLSCSTAVPVACCERVATAGVPHLSGLGAGGGALLVAAMLGVAVAILTVGRRTSGAVSDP